MKYPNLAVLEGRWFSGKNVSIKGVFDLLSDIHLDTPHGFHYEMFNNGEAFKEIVTRLGARPGIHNLYIASHGDNGCIYGSNGETINRAVIKNALKEVARTERAVLKGVYFGACHFVDEELTRFLLLDGDVSIKWLAGYEKKIDWISSTAFDWCFWNEFFKCRDMTDVRQLEETADFIKKNLDGLRKSLSFRLYRRKGRDVVQVL